MTVYLFCDVGSADFFFSPCVIYFLLFDPVLNCKGEFKTVFGIADVELNQEKYRTV